MRQLVWAALPLGKGIILDPFMGAGSTIAATEALGYKSIGIEIDRQFLGMAGRAIPQLAALEIDWKSFEGANGNPLAKPQLVEKDFARKEKPVKALTFWQSGG